MNKNLTILDKKIIITDCLSDDLREKLLVDCKPFLRKLGNDYPAYQSDNNISNYPQFQLVHQIFHSLACKYLEEELLPERSWFIMTEGKKEQSIMHDHPADYVGVYYIYVGMHCSHIGIYYSYAGVHYCGVLYLCEEHYT